MKKIYILSLLCACIAGIIVRGAPPCYADFDDLGAGARAIGLGNSFTAVCDDAFAIYYNPAGLGFMRTGQVGADFSKLYFGLDDGSNLTAGFGSIVLPIIKAKLLDVTISSAAAMAQSGMSSSYIAISTSMAAGADASTSTVKVTYYRHLGTAAFGWRFFSLADYYQESAYYFSYGRSVANKWAWGVNLKMLQEKYMIDDYLKASPVFAYGAKDSVSAMSLDIGGLYNPIPRLFLGASLTDINQPNLGLLQEDKLPYGLRLGMAWKERGLLWAFDGVYRQSQWYYSTGFERSVAKVLGLRAGIGMGGHNYFNIAAGFTFNFYRAQLDYAFQYPLSGIKDIAGTHRMSFVFRFGRRSKEETEIGSIEYYYSQLQDEVENVRQRLVQTKSEKDNLESILLEEATLRIRERIKAAKAEAARTSVSQSAPVRNAEPREKEPKEVRHVVKQGETLQSIAEKYYGATKFWDEIYKMNKDSVGRGGVLKPNQVLVIPVLSKSDSPEPLEASSTAPEKSQEREAPSKPAVPEQTKEASQEAQGEKVVPVKAVTPSGTSSSGVSGIERIVPIKDERELSVERNKVAPREGQTKSGITVSRRHLVQPGENLRTIAQKYYNDSNRWKDIYQANRDKVISGQVSPGQEIVIP